MSQSGGNQNGFDTAPYWWLEADERYMLRRERERGNATATESDLRPRFAMAILRSRLGRSMTFAAAMGSSFERFLRVSMGN